MSNHLPYIRRDQPHVAQKLEHGKEAPKFDRDWTCRIHFQINELGNPFEVLIFLGDVPDDPEQWRYSPSFVSSRYAYGPIGLDYGYKAEGPLAQSFVPLSAAIKKLSGLSSYESSEVVPYLKDNLHWRIMNHGTVTPVEPAGLRSLEVTVMSSLVDYDQFPYVTKGIEYYRDIAYGRPGGARQAQA